MVSSIAFFISFSFLCSCFILGLLGWLCRRLRNGQNEKSSVKYRVFNVICFFVVFYFTVVDILPLSPLYVYFLGQIVKCCFPLWICGWIKVQQQLIELLAGRGRRIGKRQAAYISHKRGDIYFVELISFDGCFFL